MYSLITLARASGADTATTYRYARASGSAGLEAVSGAYALRLFTSLTGAGLSNPLTVHNVDRWEREDRAAGATPPLATELEAQQGTLTASRSWSPKLVKDSVVYNAPNAGIVGNTILHDGPAIGITITAIGSQQVNNLELLSPKFDLGRSYKWRGSR